MNQIAKLGVRSVAVCLLASMLFLNGCTNKNQTAGQVNDGFRSPITEQSVVTDVFSYENGSYLAEEAIQSAIKNMELRLQNDVLELYLGKPYFDIAIRDKRTGRVWSSNPALYLQDDKINLSEDGKKQAFSQIAVTYYSGNDKKELYSYPDAVDGDAVSQVKIKSSGETAMELEYTLGKSGDTLVLFEAFTTEKYHAIKEKVDNYAFEIEDPIISSTFENAYRRIRYDKLEAQDVSAYEKKYPKLRELGEIYELRATTTELDKSTLSTAFLKIGESTKAIAKEYEKIGFTASESELPYFVIPIEYRLQGNDFLATIRTKGIKGTDKANLNTITLLGQFGGAYADTPGYLLLPNGSGSIIENGKGATDMNTVSFNFYGWDYGLERLKQTEEQGDCYFPVFGIKNKNAALFGVVESGDACSGITANVSNTYSSFNRVSPWFEYRKQDKIYLDEKTSLNEMIRFAASPTEQDYRIRYHFLYGDRADYSGMAQYYRTYLEQRGMLTKTEKRHDVPFYLDFIGLVKKKTLVCGIPVWTKQELTTFQQANDILQQFFNAGVPDIGVRYSGMFNGGVRYSLHSALKIERKLEKGLSYQGLEQKAEKLGYRIYPDVDIQFTKSQHGNRGYRQRKDTSVFLNKSIATYAPFDEITLKKGKNEAFIVNPASYPWIAESAANELNRLEMKRISAGKLGHILGGNYDEEHVFTRENAKYTIAQQLQRFKKQSDQILMQGANQYTLPYTEAITSLALDSTGYRIESSSVPFAQMVLHGYKDYTGAPLNLSDNYEYDVLKAAETGAGLHFMLMNSENSTLYRTELENLYAVNYRQWLKKGSTLYQRFYNCFRGLGDQTIIKHEKLQPGLFQTIYSNGQAVLTNYNNQAVQLNDCRVDAMDFAVRKIGGAE